MTFKPRNLVIGFTFWAAVLGGIGWLIAKSNTPEWYDQINADQALAHLNCQMEQCDRDLDVVLAGCVSSPPPTLPAEHASAVYGCQYEWMERKATPVAGRNLRGAAFFSQSLARQSRRRTSVAPTS
jgi:hypothetical protein